MTFAARLPFWSDAKLGIKLLVIAFVPFALTSLCIMATLLVLADVQAEEHQEQRARQIAADCHNIGDAMVMVAALLSLHSSIHDPRMIADFDHCLEQSRNSMDKLRLDAREASPDIRLLVQHLDQAVQKMQVTAEDIINLNQRRTNIRKHNLFGFLRVAQDTIDDFLNCKSLTEKLENAATASGHRVQQSPAHRFLRNNMAAAIGGTLFISLAVAWFLARDIVWRLRSLTDKAVRLALLEIPGDPAPGSDEIARLDHVFNVMAARLLDAVKREQAAIACAADIILTIDGGGTIKSANEAVEHICRWSPGELCESPVYNLVGDHEHEALRAALQTEQPAQFETSLRCRDGKQVSCIWSTSWSAGQQLTIAIAHDVTERKKAEQALADSEERARSLMQDMPAGLLLLACDASVRFANDTACKLCARSYAELVGMPFTDLLSGANFDSPSAFIDLLCRRQQAYVTAIATSTGEDKCVQLRVSKFGKQAGEELFLAVLLDHTERARFEELKQRLIAMMAHDIATPLVTVQSTLSMVSSGMFGQVEPYLVSSVSDAARESDDIARVFKNLVRFQKLAAGFSSLSAAQLRLAELTNQALDAVAESAADRALDIVSQVPDDVMALGDADKLALLGATLLQVVVESCPEGSTISVSATNNNNWAEAEWILTVPQRQPLCHRLLSYLDDVYIFDDQHSAIAGDLDLILWRLLLYQCGTKISCHAGESAITVKLIMPALPPATPLVA